MLARMGLKMTDRQFNSLAQAYDRNNSGVISYRHFTKAVAATVVPAQAGHLKVKALSRLQASADEVHGAHQSGAQKDHRFAAESSTRRRKPPQLAEAPTITKWIETRFAKRTVADTTALARAFRRFDSRATGAVSVPHFRAALKKVGVRVSNNELKLLVEAINGAAHADSAVATAGTSKSGTRNTTDTSTTPQVSLRDFSKIMFRHFVARAQDESLVDIEQELRLESQRGAPQTYVGYRVTAC